jgi:hypothetical protein
MMKEQPVKRPSPQLRELLAWVSSRTRTYAETMEAWRTSCPRHSVWEDALIDGLVRRESNGSTDESIVTLTPDGKALLDKSL